MYIVSKGRAKHIARNISPQRPQRRATKHATLARHVSDLKEVRVAREHHDPTSVLDASA
jgi:hypothetical protein